MHFYGNSRSTAGGALFGMQMIFYTGDILLAWRRVLVAAVRKRTTLLVCIVYTLYMYIKATLHPR